MQVGGGRSSRSKVFAEINITPLTDIFLVLLIIMMVVAPLSKQAPKGIKVPTTEGGKDLQDLKTVVDVTPEGAYLVNGAEATHENLGEMLKSTLAPGQAAGQLIVRGDKSAKSKDILNVLKVAKEAEFKNVTVAVEAVPSATP